MIHNNDSCSLLNTSLVLRALISVPPMEAMQSDNLGFKIPFLLCNSLNKHFISQASSFPICEVIYWYIQMTLSQCLLLFPLIIFLFISS